LGNIASAVRRGWQTESLHGDAAHADGITAQHPITHFGLGRGAKGVGNLRCVRFAKAASPACAFAPGGSAERFAVKNVRTTVLYFLPPIFLPVHESGNCSKVTCL